MLQTLKHSALGDWQMIPLLILNLQKLLNCTPRSALPYVLLPSVPRQSGLRFAFSSENGVVVCSRKSSCLTGFNIRNSSPLWASWSNVLAGPERRRKVYCALNCGALDAKINSPSFQRSAISLWFEGWNNEASFVQFQVSVFYSLHWCLTFCWMSQ